MLAVRNKRGEMSIRGEPTLAAPVEKYRSLKGVWLVLFALASIMAILITVNEVFFLKIFGVMLHPVTFMYVLLALYLSFAFIILPYSKKAPKDKIPWHDIGLFALSLVSTIYLAANAREIQMEGWGLSYAPVPITICSIILWCLVIEAARRVAGLIMACVCLFFSLVPLFALYMPGPLQGISFPFIQLVRYHAISVDSILGIPMQIVGSLLMGFMIFGVILQHMGGGTFFLKMAFSVLGWTRGGPAKVAIVTSSLFGSMSGSVMANVVTTGSLTIPAMKRAGYPPEYAGAIETCASTGGCLMPPVMGSVAFVMAGMLSIPYTHICLAAIIPSLLYYLGLFVQVDGRAVKLNLKGVPRHELAPMWQTFKEGWFYIFALLLLIYFLVVLRVIAWAPYFASAALLGLTMIRRETRINWKRFINLIAEIGKIMVELVVILVAVGLIIGGLSITGVALSFSHEAVLLVGGNVVALLAMGAIASLILGMGMTVTACYVFLAIVLAPGLVEIGLNPLAAHMFIMYWGMLSYITPPVAIGAYAAAGIAQASPMKTGFTAAKLGVIIYFIPFFFVFNPALILQSSQPIDIIWSLAGAIAGVIIIGGALEGYLLGIGRTYSVPLRVILFISGFLLALPYAPLQGMLDIIGIIGFAVVVLAIKIGGGEDFFGLKPFLKRRR